MSGFNAVITVFPAFKAVNIADGFVVPEICSIVPTFGSDESQIRFLLSVRSVAIICCCPTSTDTLFGTILNLSTLFLTVILQVVVRVKPSEFVHESVTVTGLFDGVSFFAVTVAYCPFVEILIYSLFESSDGFHLNWSASVGVSSPNIPYNNWVEPTDMSAVETFIENVCITVIFTYTIPEPSGWSPSLLNSGIFVSEF